MSDQREAILRLLNDEDPATVMMVRMKLAETLSLAELYELRAAASGRAARQLAELIMAVQQEDSDDEFAALCAKFGEYGDLEEACWMLAAVFSPGDSFLLQRETLDDWGRLAASRLSKAMSRAERVAVLSNFLGRELGLRGNDDDYYNIDNSLLPTVIDTRLGIPISLTLVYMLVGERAGLAVDGVGLPGHFMARHDDIFFDPFHSGRRVGIEECAALMEQQNLVLTPQHLAPTTPRQMLARMLINISFIADQNDPPLAAKVAAWMEALKES